jgi:DNA repair exonuclease SbcCD nuclease subunit
MKKIIAFSDLHIHNYKKNDDNGSRLENCLRVLDIVFEAATDGVILFAGDLYDSQQRIPTVVVNATVARFKQLFDKYPETTFYAISGNHDHATQNFFNNKAVSALEHLDKLFDRFVLLDNETVTIDDITIGGIPYYQDKAEFDKANEAMQQKFVSQLNIRILMIHQTPSGLGNPNIPYDLTPQEVKYASLVLCGHIHSRQQITEEFLVVGSPIHRDMGDVGTDKGYYIITPNENKLLAGFVGLNTKFISLNGKFPTFSYELPETDDLGLPTPLHFPMPTVEEYGQERTSKFSLSQGAENIISNYCEMKGADKSILEKGLQIISLAK